MLQLGRVGGLLNWDEQVNMPPRGAAARGEAKATLAGVLHERICDERFGEAIAELAGDDSLDALQRARVREGKRERDRAVRVPPALVRAIAHAESAGFEAWQAARAGSDFSLFRDPLERIISLRREEADAVGYDGGERYDALLDQYEPDMRVARLEPLLNGLRDELVPLAREIAAQPRPDDAFVHRTYPAQIQRAVGARLAAAIGFDFKAGRLDEAAHPFASGFAPGDVRLTTREHEDDLFSGLFAVLHEAGHGLYEQGLTGAIEGTFCGNATSLGLHESQSRFWENMVGRSHAFWERHLAELRDAFPEQLGDVSARAVRARRQPRRAVADPRRGRRGDLPPARLPALRARARARARRPRRRRSAGGLERAHAHARRHRRPERRARRAPGRALVGGSRRLLPDLHARHALLGAVPRGHRARARADRRDRARGEYDRLLGWMREHVHSRGRPRPARADRDRRDRRAPGHAALMRYLRAKYGALYDLAG